MMPSVEVWPVFVEGWQHECCGEPFAVGDRVAFVRVGSLTAAWAGPQPRAGQERRGLLVENHHGGRPMAAAATEGVVERVRLVRRRQGTSPPAGARVTLTELDAAPDLFSSADGWIEEGLLVDLHVDRTRDSPR